jgi:hypothetical protein
MGWLDYIHKIKIKSWTYMRNRERGDWITHKKLDTRNRYSELSSWTTDQELRHGEQI